MKRSSIQGTHKALNSVNSVRCIWTKLEDKALKAAVKLYKTKGWNCVANYVNSFLPKNPSPKNSNQCRERWSNQLNPEVQLSPLSKTEIEQVLSLHKKLGNRWSSIASKLPGRTDNVVKNWFLCKLRKLARCIKKESIDAELPANLTELLQQLYMLDYLYKYYLSLDRQENIIKSLNSQTKKRKNEGDRYINKMVDNGDITIERLSLFVKLLLDEVRFTFDKSIIQNYEYLLKLPLIQSCADFGISEGAPSSDVRNETFISTSRNLCIMIIFSCYCKCGREKQPRVTITKLFFE